MMGVYATSKLELIVAVSKESIAVYRTSRQFALRITSPDQLLIQKRQCFHDHSLFTPNFNIE